MAHARSLPPVPADERIYISELAKIVNRRPNTIRGWCSTTPDGRPKLPPQLLPQRDRTMSQGGWRYWTADQAEGIKRWMADNNVHPLAGMFAPGGGRHSYSPDAERRVLAQMRGPRRAA